MVFGSIQIGNLEKILQSFELPEETVNAIKMLIKNVKSYVRWADGDTKYFETGWSSPRRSNLCLEHILRKSPDSKSQLGFTLTQGKTRRHTAKETTDVDYFSELAVLSRHLSYATILLKSLEKFASETDLNANLSKQNWCHKTKNPEPMRSMNGEQKDL